MLLIITVGLGAVLVASFGDAIHISDFDWATIKPSASLKYTSCYEGHKCAKLSVPLNWLDPGNIETPVILAIVALPAVVNETDPSFGGTIIVNPGGPGSSGVSFVLSAGKLIQKTADGNKKYEILSFDPRGVGLTTPNSDCFRNEVSRGHAAITQHTIGLLGLLDVGKGVLRRTMSRAKAFGELCQAKSQGDDDIRSFMSTSSVARDMVEIVDKIAELRKENNLDDKPSSDLPLELRSAPTSPARIQYWGLSYGSALGNYFASMFPGRVGRLILEGVVDIQDYADGTWAMNVNEVQQVYDYFWDTCYDAGPICALYHKMDTGPKDIRDRFNAFIDKLDQFPASYIADSSIISIAREDVMIVIFSGLIQPQAFFPSLATTLAAAMMGNFTMLYSQIGQPSAHSCPSLTPQTYTWRKDASVAISCGDGEPQNNMTLSDYEAYMTDLKAKAPDFWPFFADIRLPCTGWRFRPKYRFTGPWVTPESNPKLVYDKPAAPVLFTSSRLDPLTPVANAIEASKGHPGSRILIQDSVGHGALASPSECRENYIKNYFETGEVSRDDTICASDCVPFQDCDIGLLEFGQ